MSSVLDPQPDPPAADEIVAYLDGELAPPDCRRVESRLATDEEYRQQLHELDRAWEALDALPTTTVDDGFARTTIELACVAAEADLTEHTAIARAAKRIRTWQWLAAGVAAVVIGFLADRGLISNRNAALLADLPAIHQVNVLQDVEDVEFLRRLSAAVPLEQLIKDWPAFERNVKELDSVNSPLLDKRREWVKALQPEQKAELEDRARVFGDLEPSTAEQERMRNVMADIRSDADAPNLQKTLVAYGQWLSRHTAGQQQQLREERHDLPADKQAELIQKRVEREGFLHLTPEDADALRREIIQVAKEKRLEIMERMRQGRKADRVLNLEGPPAPQSTMIVAELFKGNKREETEKRLIAKLSPAAQAHWDSLGRGQRDFGKPRQLWVWIQDAMKLKVDPEELERFFASDKLTPDQRQQLLDRPRAEMDAALERLYLRSELGIEYPGQLFGDFGEAGRMPRGGPGPAGQQWRPEGARPDGLGPGEPVPPDGRRPRQRLGRPPGPGGVPEQRPDDRPNERRPPNRPQQPGPDHPPSPDQKQEAI